MKDYVALNEDSVRDFEDIKEAYLNSLCNAEVAQIAPTALGMLAAAVAVGWLAFQLAKRPCR